MNTSTADAETTHMPVINETASDFKAETTQGTIRFRDWIGDSWAVLSSHPKDFTPVCTTELGTMAALQPEFAKKNTKIVGLSVDLVSNHERWVTDIEDTQGCRVNYPIIGDPRLEVAKLYGMLPAGKRGQQRRPYRGEQCRRAHCVYDRRGEGTEAIFADCATTEVKIRARGARHTWGPFGRVVVQS